MLAALRAHHGGASEEGVDELFTNQLKEAARSCPVPVQFTTGGATRTASTLNGLRALAEREHSASVAVHDAARPFVPHHVLDALLAARKAGADGAVPALPITDTVKQVDRKQIILSTIDRTSLRRVQTLRPLRLTLYCGCMRRLPGVTAMQRLLMMPALLK